MTVLKNRLRPQLPWLAAASAAVVAFYPAAAAAADGSRDPILLPTIVVLGALGMLTAIVGLSIRLRSVMGERDRQAAEVLLASGAIGAAPGGYILWSGGISRMSLAASALLDRPAPTAIEPASLPELFAPADAAALRDAIGALTSKGTSFDLVLARADSGRRLRVCGRRSLSPLGRGAIDALWLSDATEAAADAAARRERDRLSSLLDSLPIAVWSRDADLRIDYCNEAYARAVDLTRDKALARAAEIGRGAIAEGGKALARRAGALGTAQSESQHIVVAGQRRLMDFIEQPLAGGRLGGHALDVTNLEATQAELARHIAAHGDVLEQLSTGVVIFGPDARLKFFNSAYCDLFDLREDFLAGEPTFAEVIDAQRERRRIAEHADFPAYKRETERQLMSVIQPKEELMHLPDGTTFREVAAPHPFGGILILYEDVTDRLALERSHNTLIAVQRETLDNLYEAVAVFGEDGRLKLHNPAYARLWNLDPAALRNEPHVTELVEATRGLFQADREWQALRERIVGRVMAREPWSERLERPDGKVLHVTAVPLPDGGMLFTYLDVTDSMRVERALRERNAALETADRLKSEFIANVSYELRTPLNAIIGFAGILDLEYFGTLNDRQKEYSRAIVEASQSLMSLINDILDIATIEAGYLKLDLAEVDIALMFGRLQTLVGERARSGGLELVIDCPKDIGGVTGDERRLTQALFNLVSNSLKFTPSGGRIEVKARKSGEEVLLKVSDTGIGIAAEDQEEAFEKFTRTRASGHESGVGLGLALVKSLIELHGGSVHMESTPGEGTSVTCRIPVKAVAAKDSREAARG